MRFSLVKDMTQEAYKKAIMESCEYIKNELVDEMLSDMNNRKIENIEIKINVAAGEVSVVGVNKSYFVKVGENSD